MITSTGNAFPAIKIWLKTRAMWGQKRRWNCIIHHFEHTPQYTALPNRSNKWKIVLNGQKYRGTFSTEYVMPYQRGTSEKDLTLLTGMFFRQKQVLLFFIIPLLHQFPLFGQEIAQNMTAYYTVIFCIFTVVPISIFFKYQLQGKCNGITNPLLDGLTYNMCRHFAHCYPHILHVKPLNKVYLVMSFFMLLLH